MLASKIQFFLVFIFISTILCSNTLNNPHVQKKLQQKLKQERHVKHKTSYQKSSCDEIKDWTPKEDRELFIISNQNTLASIKSVSPNLDNCNGHADFNMIEIVWRYHFFESLHCIRVELDLGESLNKFINATNYQYYSFSYRELGKKNNYLTRQNLNESLNVLTIKRANLRPYIICVNFYKNENIYAPVSLLSSITTSNDTNSTNEVLPELSCPEYYGLLHQDDYTHNIDLCVDIDTQAHFLSDIGQDSHSNRERLMVLFIVILLVVMLTSITVANYIIQKPKKRLLLHNLRKYIMHKRSHGHSHAHGPDDHNGDHHHDDLQTLTRSSSLGTKMGSSRPQIVISDFSSKDSLDQQPYYLAYHNHNSKAANTSSEDPHETESLLMKTGANGGDKPPSPEKSMLASILKPSGDDHSAHLHSVTFHVGETIIEESEEPNNDPTTPNETEKPSVASMSHILDDKPWMFGRSSSLVASSCMSGNSGSRSTFENDIQQVSKRFNGSNNASTTSNSSLTAANTAANSISSDITIVNETNKMK